MWKEVERVWENRTIGEGLGKTGRIPSLGPGFSTASVESEKPRHSRSPGPFGHGFPRFHTLYYYRYPFFLKEKQFILPVETLHRTPFSEA